MHDKLLWWVWALGFALSVCLVQSIQICVKLRKRKTDIGFNIVVGSISGFFCMFALQLILFALVNEVK